ncbi:MAG: poly-gamma-glutamate biosynthesis protein PgsC [Bacteroidales bacterium]|nr:poly-gamma-glutamate biosynthesis protein PgsC [Bacteroidales bacterium]
MPYELFFIGLLVTLLFITVTGYYPGGIIVPGYLVLFAEQPLRILGTLAAALIAWLIYLLCARYLILYGKRRFVLLILLGAVLSFSISYLLPQLFPDAIEFKVIGWVIPGLIANQTERQGPGITLSALVIVTTLLFFIGKLWIFIT